jgi:hypothetical protein
LSAAADERLSLAYGTSQRTRTLHRGEFAILREINPVGYEAAGLSYDAKFDLRQMLDLPYSTDWFTVPPTAPQDRRQSWVRCILPGCAPCRRPFAPFPSSALAKLLAQVIEEGTAASG